MKVDRLETHDRLLVYQKQQQDMNDAVLECIKNVPDTIRSPFYVYGHSRTVGYDEKISILVQGSEYAPDTRLIWMPVITKPKAVPNTYLFLANKNTDVIEIVWMLPKKELWNQYAPKQMCFNENIWVSIQNFIYDKDQLNSPDKNGPTEKQQEEWFKIYGHEAHKRKNMKESAKRMSKPKTLEAF